MFLLYILFLFSETGKCFIFCVLLFRFPNFLKVVNRYKIMLLKKRLFAINRPVSVKN